MNLRPSNDYVIIKNYIIFLKTNDSDQNIYKNSTHI